MRNQDIDAAFEEWWEQEGRGHHYNSGLSVAGCMRVAFLSGAACGVEKATAAHRGLTSDITDTVLARRIAASTVPELMAADAGKVDVTG